MAFFPMHFSGMLGMPRRVYTYPAGMGFDLPNMISSLGAFVLAGGFLVVLWDLFRPKGKQPLVPRNVWVRGRSNGPGRSPTSRGAFGSIPLITTRYPLWNQANFIEDIDSGNFYLPDAEEEKRETLVTSTVDARPLQCLRVPGPSFLPFWAASFTGGVFIFSTFHWWWPVAVCARCHHHCDMALDRYGLDT